MMCFCILFMAVSSAIAQPTIIAHRGASYLAPENTVAAAQLAWELGADAVEIDIHLSADGKVMVNHDHTTKRTGGEELKIAESQSASLRKLDVGTWKSEKYKGEKIPFIAEVLETIPEGKHLVVEIKCGSEVLPALREAVDASGKQDQIIFISFGWQTIVDTKAKFPDNECYWLSSSKDKVNEKIEEVAQLGLDGINLHSSIVDQAMMDRAAALDLKVLCWTVDSPEEAKRVKELGIGGITTNRPAWLKERI